MIKCFIALCMVGNATVCQPPMEIVPADDVMITSPIQCGRGGMIVYTTPRMQDNPDTPGATGNRETIKDGQLAPVEWFPKIYGKQIGDGAGEIEQWLHAQRAKAERLTPQIK